VVDTFNFVLVLFCPSTFTNFSKQRHFSSTFSPLDILVLDFEFFETLFKKK